MFSWFRHRKRRKLLDEPFPANWEAILHQNVGHFPRLDVKQQQKLRTITRVLIAEKVWEGCGGLDVTEEIQVTTAAQAALPILGMNHDYYSRVPSIILYPSSFLLPAPDETGDEFFTPTDKIVDGVATYRGPVVFGWDQVLSEGRDPTLGQNVVIHEFAHQLDHLDNEQDGVPPLPSGEMRRRWRDVMTYELEEHRRALDRKEETFFTEHAAENLAEFFADASESFFCLPHDLQVEYPEVFELLQAFYRLDPRVWFPEDA
jgi:Mlc titration factor MtfA (ptsG expression regulator)